MVRDVVDPGGRPLAAVGMAHARLAILDLDPRSDQPFETDGHWLAYNGEIYDFRALTPGMERRTEGDTEALLWLLRQRGLGALAEANGMWAFCWLDPQRRVLTAARDRYGKKPLFYRFDADRIAFASEPGALHVLWGTAPTARRDRLDGFLAEGWLLPEADGTTFLEGVHEVRPGHALEFDLASWTFREVHAAPIEFGSRDHEAEDPERLPALLADAVEARLLSSRKVALLLSGGVDSSLILSILAARGRLGEVVCVLGDAGKSEDADYARACLSAVGAKGLDLALDYGGAGLSHFLTVCAHQAKPFPLIGNVLGMAALYRAAAGEGVSVALDGTGADELFGGYWQRQAGFALRDAARQGDSGLSARLRAGGMLPPELASRDDAALLSGPLPTPQRDALSEEDVALLRPECAAAVRLARSSDPLSGHEGSFAEALVADAGAGRMQEWLWQNDRNAMASGIENRSPFLDHRLARHRARRGADAFDGAFNKVRLRALFPRFVALPTAARTEKQGFRWVYGRFLRQNAAALVELMAGSKLVAEQAPIDRLARLMAEPQAAVGSRLVQRLIVLAGLEATGRLVSDGG